MPTKKLTFKYLKFLSNLLMCQVKSVFLILILQEDGLSYVMPLDVLKIAICQKMNKHWKQTTMMTF